MNKTKRQPTEWEKNICKVTDKGLISKIYRVHAALCKNNKSNQKETEDLLKTYRWPKGT